MLRFKHPFSDDVGAHIGKLMVVPFDCKIGTFLCRIFSFSNCCRLKKEL